ncbi:MAG TPA: phosphate ABC transporter, permease protein PstA, partial [Opitutae bacterium]|nr:phosphate ABC transporter, permease protein PstA [Opitutae bacterium]
PGILTGAILAISRAAGEVAPLMLTGVVGFEPDLPISTEAPFIHLQERFMHLGFHIYDLAFQSPDSDAAKPMVFATTLLLIVLVIVLNLSAITIRNHLRKKYKGDTF